MLCLVFAAVIPHTIENIHIYFHCVIEFGGIQIIPNQTISREKHICWTEYPKLNIIGMFCNQIKLIKL